MPTKPEEYSENGFTYKPRDYLEDRWEISYQSEEEEGGEHLGSIFLYTRKETTGWCFDRFGHQMDSLNIPDDVRYRPVFPSKEHAARALLMVARGINANPLPDYLRDYVRQRERDLRNERNHLLKRFYDLKYEMLSLQQIADKSQLGVFDFGVDTKKEIADLNNFLNEHMDELYDKFGKDWARSLRAYIASVVRLIDPEVAGDI